MNNKNKYYIKAGEVNKAFKVMRKEMLEQLDKFRIEVVVPLLLKGQEEDKRELLKVQER